jgi:hypothetical protein
MIRERVSLQIIDEKTLYRIIFHPSEHVHKLVISKVVAE